MKVTQPSGTRLSRRANLPWIRDMSDEQLLAATFDHPYDKERLYELAFRAVWYGVEGIVGVTWEQLPQIDNSGVRVLMAVATGIVR